MDLGTLIGRLRRDADAGTALEALGDIVLIARVAEMAAVFDETSSEYVAAGVGRFAAAAEDEAWLGLVAAMERAEDPGSAALRRMLEWALARDENEVRQPATEPHTCGGGSCLDQR